MGKFWRDKMLASERNLTFWVVKYLNFLDGKILANVTSGD